MGVDKLYNTGIRKNIILLRRRRTGVQNGSQVNLPVTHPTRLCVNLISNIYVIHSSSDFQFLVPPVEPTGTTKSGQNILHLGNHRLTHKWK